MRRRILRAALCGLLALTALTSWPAFAQGSTLSTVAVQNRRHLERHEFGVAVGVLPLDAFTKGVTVSGAYTLHFDELFAWELVQGTYAFPMDTHLKADLDALDVQPTPFERVEWYATSAFMFKPIYWKGTLLNANLVYGEIFFTVGGGFGGLTRSRRPAAEVGMGMRLYASERISFRIDIRDIAFFTASDVQNELWIGLGISL